MSFQIPYSSFGSRLARFKMLRCRRKPGLRSLNRDETWRSRDCNTSNFASPSSLYISVQYDFKVILHLIFFPSLSSVRRLRTSFFRHSLVRASIRRNPTSSRCFFVSNNKRVTGCRLGTRKHSETACDDLTASTPHSSKILIRAASWHLNSQDPSSSTSTSELDAAE